LCFLGYSPLHKGYRCLDTNTHRVYISRHVVFNENDFPYLSRTNSIKSQSYDSSITTFPNSDEWFSGNTNDTLAPKDSSIITSKPLILDEIDPSSLNSTPPPLTPTNQDPHYTNKWAMGLIPGLVSSWTEYQVLKKKRRPLAYQYYIPLK